MYEQEIMARKLGFESAEEMEKYYDLCLPIYKQGAHPTKELCQKDVVDEGLEELLSVPREERLRSMALKYYETMLLGIEYHEEESHIDYCRKIAESYVEKLREYVNEDVKTK